MNSKKYFDFGLLLEHKMDRFDRISFFLDSFNEWKLLHGVVDIKKFRKDMSFASLLGEWLGDIESCFVEKDKLTDDLHAKFRDVAMVLIDENKEAVTDTVGSTFFVVFKDGFGMFDAMNRIPLAVVRADDNNLIVSAVVPPTDISFGDIHILLEDKTFLERTLKYVKDEYDSMVSVKGNKTN